MRLSEYQRVLEPHRRALAKLELDLEFFLEDMGDIDIYNIQKRIKALESTLSKSKRLNIDVTDLDDLAGLRIVVGTQSQLPIIERFFTRQEYGNDLKIIKRNDFQRKSGYRAIHLVVELKSHYQRSVHPGRVEVQLATVFGNAFNFLSRSWRYKSNAELEKEWDKEFYQLSQSLNELESIAASLHKRVLNAAAFDDLSSLTPHSYRIILHNEFDEEVKYEDAVDSCRWYTDIGIDTNGSLKSFFRNSEINELYSYAMKNSKGSEPLSQLVTMGKASFWSIFGTRINSPGMKEFFKSLVKAEHEQ